MTRILYQQSPTRCRIAVPDSGKGNPSTYDNNQTTATVLSGERGNSQV